MTFVGSMRMPVMAFVDALLNSAAIWILVSASAWPNVLAMLTEVAHFSDEMFTGWGVPFQASERGTSGVRSLMSAPSPGISGIRSQPFRWAWNQRRVQGFL
jgi:hypothetical protein